MDLGITGKVVAVTGGASGIGRATVDALLAEGARVVILDRNPTGESIAEQLRAEGYPVSFVATDVTDEANVAASINSLVAEQGALDMVVGCAGISGPVGKRISEVDAAEWDRVMAVNLRGNFFVAKHSVAHLEASDIGTMTILASDSAVVAFEGMGPYNASKAAVVMLAKSIAVDHPKLRVNAVCPGIVDTPMSRADLGLEEIGFVGSGLPVMQASQIARQVVFLASPVSAPMNATTLLSDFGYAARSALGGLDFEG